jgi:hypothetical protein
VPISWEPDYFDPHSNAETFAHHDDDSDRPKVKPLAWRNHWYIPELTKLKSPRRFSVFILAKIACLLAQGAIFRVTYVVTKKY